MHPLPVLRFTPYGLRKMRENDAFALALLFVIILKIEQWTYCACLTFPRIALHFIRATFGGLFGLFRNFRGSDVARMEFTEYGKTIL